MSVIRYKHDDVCVAHALSSVVLCQPRPNKTADYDLGICGDVRLQVVLSDSLLSTFSPVWLDQEQPEEKYANALLLHNVDRVKKVFESFNFKWLSDCMQDIFMYKNPALSIVFLIVTCTIRTC